MNMMNKVMYEQHVRKVEKTAEQKVVCYMEKISKAQKDVELWEQEQKKILQRCYIQEFEHMRKQSVIDDIQQVLQKDS